MQIEKSDQSVKAADLKERGGPGAPNFAQNGQKAKLATPNKLVSEESC